MMCTYHLCGCNHCDFDDIIQTKKRLIDFFYYFRDAETNSIDSDTMDSGENVGNVGNCWALFFNVC